MGAYSNSLAMWGFSQFHGLCFCHGSVWQLQTVGLVQALLPCTCGCLHMSLLPLKSFIPLSWSGAETETGPWRALPRSGAHMPGFIRLSQDVLGSKLMWPSLWFCVSPSGLGSCVLGLGGRLPLWTDGQSLPFPHFDTTWVAT